MTIDINCYAFGNAAQNRNCAKGPIVLKEVIEETDLAPVCQFKPILHANNHTPEKTVLQEVQQICTELAENTQRSVSTGRFFITLGGDHSAAIGTWSGASIAMDTQGELGLIWVDAHMDSHTPETSPTQNIHGMPLAVLLGSGAQELTKILSENTKLNPKNVVLIGIRSYEQGEADFLKSTGATIFDMQTIEQLGLDSVIDQAIDLVTKQTHGFGISIDLDAFDPKDAPGTGTIAANGIHAGDFLKTLPKIAKHPKLMGAEIVEFSPDLDRERRTEKLAMALFRTFVTAQSGET